MTATIPLQYQVFAINIDRPTYLVSLVILLVDLLDWFQHHSLTLTLSGVVHPAPQRFVRFYSCPDYIVEEVNTHLLILAPFLLRFPEQRPAAMPCLPPSTYGPISRLQRIHLHLLKTSKSVLAQSLFCSRWCKGMHVLNFTYLFIIITFVVK